MTEWVYGNANVYEGYYAFATCSPNMMSISQSFYMTTYGYYKLYFHTACGNVGYPYYPVCYLKISINNRLIIDLEITSYYYAYYETYFTADNDYGTLTIEANANCLFWIDSLWLGQIGNY